MNARLQGSKIKRIRVEIVNCRRKTLNSWPRQPGKGTKPMLELWFPARKGHIVIGKSMY